MLVDLFYYPFFNSYLKASCFTGCPLFKKNYQDVANLILSLHPRLVFLFLVAITGKYQELLTGYIGENTIDR